MVTILDGRATADELLDTVASEVKILKSKNIQPKLVVIVVGEDPASAVYVRHKAKACQKVGIESEQITYPDDISQDELLTKIDELNKDDSVNGIIVQLPLPKHIEESKVIKAIDPYKDVDGFHAYNIGKMVLDKDFEDLAPCTPKGITLILEKYNIDVEGMNVCVIGRSNIVGKPIGLMLLNRNATVSITHSRTKNLSDYTKSADLIVIAVGRPKMLTADMVKDEVIIIDVGINRVDGKLCGDADFDELQAKASAITPVPGGVGPMTVACLMANTVTAAKKGVKI